MLTEDYLNLKLVRLKASGQWKRDIESISFIFPRAGVGHYLKGSTRQSLSAGEVFLLNGDTTAQICSPANGDFVFWAFAVRLEHLYPLFATSEISLLHTVMESFKGYRHYISASPVAIECHKIIAEIPPQSNLDHRGYLLQVASLILNEEFKAAHAKRVGFVRAEDHLVQVFEELSTDEMLNLSVPDLAKRFGCSRRHLNRLFHQYFGFSVASLRMEMRLIKAVSLLRDSEAKVINVAEQCGFNHLGLFNACFRKRFGTSPGKWRKALERQNENHHGRNGNELGCPLRVTGLCPWPEGPRSKDQTRAPLSTNQRGAESLKEIRLKTRKVDQPSVTKVEFTVAAAQSAASKIAFQVRAPK